VSITAENDFEYQYSTIVLKYRSSTSSTQYNNTAFRSPHLLWENLGFLAASIQC